MGRSLGIPGGYHAGPKPGEFVAALRAPGHAWPQVLDMAKARAMILGAGFGTRLRPLTDELPKPLVPLGDRPIVSHLAERLAAQGFSELVMNVHHGAEKFSSHIERLGWLFTLVHEPVIRGTAGGVAGARAHLGPAPVVVWNGDVVASPSLAELSDAAGSGLALTVAPRRCGEGTVGVDGAGRLVRLRSETFGVETAGGDYIGVAAVGEALLAALPDTGCLVGDVALPLLRRGEVIRAVVTHEPWTDIGSLGAYHAANLAWLAQAPGVTSGGSWVHPGASVDAGVELRASIVGEGARVEGTGVVERCVLWPGARARAPLRDVIVTTLGLEVRIP